MTKELAMFFGALANIARVGTDAQRQLDRELATGFNAAKLFQPNELRLSDIFATLLDPTESHGQGLRFLNLFIEMFRDSLQRTRRPTVSCCPGTS